MEKIETIAKLKTDIVGLRSEVAPLDKDVRKLLEHIDDDKFIPEDLGNHVRNTLSSIDVLQKGLFGAFNELGVGRLPNTITDTEAALDAKADEFKSVALWKDCLDFISRLHSPAPMAETFLDIARSEIAAMEPETLGNEELEKAIEKYIKLKEVYIEESAEKKADLYIELVTGGQFPKELLIQLNVSGGLYLEDAIAKADVSDNNQPPAKDEKCASTTLAEIEIAEVLEKAEPTVEDETAELSSKDGTDSEKESDSLEEVAYGLVDGKGEDDSKFAEFDSDERRTRLEKALKGLTIPKNTVFTDYLSELIDVKTEKDKKGKKFNVSSIKGELQADVVKSTLLLISLWGFAACDVFEICSPKRNAVAKEFQLDKLVKSGYVKRITDPNLGNIYTITELGMPIFESPTARKILNFEGKPIFNNHGKYSVSNIRKVTAFAVVDMGRTVWRVTRNPKVTKDEHITDFATSNGFSKSSAIFREKIKVNDEVFQIACTGVFDTSFDFSFSKAVKLVKQMLREDDVKSENTTLIILGTSAEQAKSVTEWMVENIPEIKAIQLCYKVIGKEEVYRLHDDSCVDLYEELVEHLNNGKGGTAGEEFSTEKDSLTESSVAASNTEDESAEKSTEDLENDSTLTAVPEAVYCHEYLEPFKVSAEVLKKNTKFKAASIRKELVGAVRQGIKHIAEFGFFTPKIFAILLGNTNEPVDFAFYRMLKDGYLVKTSYDKVGSIYTISPFGKKLYKTQSIKNALGLKTTLFEEMSDDFLSSICQMVGIAAANAVENIFSDMYPGGLKFSSPIFRVDALGICPNAYFGDIEFDNGASVLEIVVCGVYANSFNKDFTEFLESMSSKKREQKKPSDLYIVVPGVSKAQAKALIGWYLENNEGASCDNICYKVIGEKGFYRYADDKEIVFDEALLKAISKNKDAVVEIAKQDEDAPVDVELVADDNIEDEQVEENEAKDTQASNKSAVASDDGTDTDLCNQVAPEAAPITQTEILSEEKIALYKQDAEKMLSEGKVYCATAYYKALSLKYPEFDDAYHQIAYAVNDPAMSCIYSSDSVSNVFLNSEAVDDYFFASAGLRCAFSDQVSYDYNVPLLQGVLESNVVVEEYPELKDSLYKLFAFKKEHNAGLDRYADYRRKDEAFKNKILKDLAVSAKEKQQHFIYENTDSKNNRRYSETVKLIFDRKGIFDKYLGYVANRIEDFDKITEMKDYLASLFIRDDSIIDPENIDKSKVEKYIDEKWEIAGSLIKNVHRSSNLVSGMRSGLFNRILSVIEVLAQYILVAETSAETDERVMGEYNRVKKDALADFKALTIKLKGALEKGCASAIVLKKTVDELVSRLDGSYVASQHKYFYKNFLKNKYVLLNSRFIPYFYDVDDELGEISCTARIKKHAAEEEIGWDKRLDMLLGEEDNFGSIELILELLDETRDSRYSEKYKEETNFEDSKARAIAGITLEKKNFIERIELRQSFGQIDSTDSEAKFRMMEKMDECFNEAVETGNYGFYKLVGEAYIQKIQNDSKVIGERLKESLEGYKESHEGWAEDETIARAVGTIESRIEGQNYTAAEDLLNRLEDDELQIVSSSIHIDYFEDFMNQYERNYRDVQNMKVNIKTILSSIKGAKDRKGAEALSNKWIADQRSIKTQTVTALFEALAFRVEKVEAEASISDKYPSFSILLKKPVNGRKNNYSHPISAFGSIAEEKPFRAVFLFGRFDENSLVSVMKEIGEERPTMIFLDFALSASVRRAIARKTKEAFHQIFAVVDRVAFCYLVSRYTETAVQNMLMDIVMPFTYYQPYVSSSVKLMPPEIFMGRKNELHKIESADGVNIVYGGRQLGKSALLQRAQRDINFDESGDRAVLVTIKGLDYEKAAMKVSRELSMQRFFKKRFETSDWYELADAIKDVLLDPSNKIPYFLLLLDEADAFIESSAQVEYAPIDALKDIQGIGIGRFKFVMAGLRNVIQFDRERALGNNSVLTQLSSLTVKPFSVSEAMELLEVPLSYLGFRFGKDERTEALVASIFSNTNYFPGLLQLYCEKLVESMRKPDYAGYDEFDSPAYMVSETHIQKILGERELQEEIRNKFIITLELDDDNFYYVIALLITYAHYNNEDSQGCTPKEIISMAKEFDISKFNDMSVDKVGVLMNEMRELNILQLVGKDGYRMNRFNFYQMMGTEDDVFTKLCEMG